MKEKGMAAVFGGDSSADDMAWAAASATPGYGSEDDEAEEAGVELVHVASGPRHQLPPAEERPLSVGRVQPQLMPRDGSVPICLVVARTQLGSCFIRRTKDGRFNLHVTGSSFHNRSPICKSGDKVCTRVTRYL